MLQGFNSQLTMLDRAGGGGGGESAARILRGRFRLSGPERGAQAGDGDAGGGKRGDMDDEIPF